MDRRKANTIKPGSLWKKKDMGIVVKIIAKGKDDKYVTARVNKNLGSKASHSIKKHDLLKHYIAL